MRFRIYRGDIHGRPYVFEGAYATVEEVLQHLCQAGEEYRILVDHKKSYALAEFRTLAAQQEFTNNGRP